MDYLVSNSFAGNDYFSILLKSYILSCKNKDIQKLIMNSVKDPLWQGVLAKKYNATPVEYEQDGKKYIHYSCGNNLWDENINLFSEGEIQAFNDKLGLMLFDNEWTQITIAPKDTNVKKVMLGLMYGAGTSTISVLLSQYDNTEPEFISEIGKSSENLYQKKYQNWEIEEFKKEGELERAGADRIFIGIGYGQDTYFKEMLTGDAVIYLYNRSLGKGYSVSYSFNISTANNNYELFTDMLRRVSMMTILTYINN